jgi:hypothetical protein
VVQGTVEDCEDRDSLEEEKEESSHRDSAETLQSACRIWSGNRRIRCSICVLPSSTLFYAGLEVEVDGGRLRYLKLSPTVIW